MTYKNNLLVPRGAFASFPQRRLFTTRSSKIYIYIYTFTYKSANLRVPTIYEYIQIRDPRGRNK